MRKYDPIPNTPNPKKHPMDSIDTIETERLTAERFRLEHYDLLCRMHRDPAVMATLGGVRADEMTRQFLEENVTHWESHGFGLWILRDRTSGDFAGRGGLKYIDVGGHLEIELGYSFLADYWGRGLATEIAETSLVVGFDRLGLGNLVCFTLTTNFASQRVMQKVGFTFEREVVHKGRVTLLSRMTRDEYRLRRSG